MIFSLTIAGAAKQLKAGTLNIVETANRRATATFRLDSFDRSYRPAQDAEVIMLEDGNRIFAGLINNPREYGFGGPRHPGISTDLHVIDFHVYAERRFVNETLAAGTLKSQLTTLVTTYLSGYGVTLDAGQVNGPMMPELTYDYKRFDVVMNELMTLTAGASGSPADEPFIWEISYTKVLSAYQPSSDPAPFNLVGNDLPEVVGDIEVFTSRSDHYATRVILKAIPKREVGRVESFTGDGVTTTFDLEYQLIDFPYGIIHVFELDGVTPAGGETFGRVGTTPVQWEYDSTTNQITRTAGATDATKIYKLTFEGEFSGVWIADAGAAAADLVERVIQIESVPNDATGQAFADAELAKRIAPIKIVKYTTWEQDLQIGQQQTINVSARNVNGTAVISDIRSRDLVHRLERQVTAIIDATQTNIGRSFQDDYEIWYGDKAGTSATVVGEGGAVAVGPAPPLTSVQFNDFGSFGGDDAFTYLKDGNSIAMGGGGTAVTAAGAESCGAFGYNCQVRD